MSSLMNLMDEMVGEGETHHVPNQTFQAEKVDVDEFSELLRELRTTLDMSRNEETRCIVRALLVLLQVVNESRLHIREIHARLDEMISNTKDLRLRTTEVLATVEKENCLNIPQAAIKNEVRRVVEEYGTLFPESKQIQEISSRLCADNSSLKTITKMSSLVKKRLVKERHEISTKVKSLDHLPLDDLVKSIFSSAVDCSYDSTAVVILMILREFFRHDEEDQSRMLKESNTTSPPQYAEFMKNKFKDDIDMKRKVFDLASEVSVGKRPRRHHD
mmetsp:Transcript_19055/g.26278  ORF Transcript_19055/g.26278 Transcript_19055/m.26278 type:complete len:274 (+) Transcript_19055:113-934(+)|eukprot:CAMPEP_0201476480 /NCGR_PEP_ID=MMETSP0151_2-20130828/1679_1 /ASSEMBLY_ACC=CAM_ASM_000257 /TAXON_ID=200890 /ORGANISM="Paramoeba atlantica, Strain 621/1 / CCAP 1560/9" /LENGTH=273 /DNA_ID=CAMNT_0047856857 /DNA_START=111 /DNA_END=932 /DNA_ORIENTATION=+